MSTCFILTSTVLTPGVERKKVIHSWLLQTGPGVLLLLYSHVMLHISPPLNLLCCDCFCAPSFSSYCHYTRLPFEQTQCMFLFMSSTQCIVQCCASHTACSIIIWLRICNHNLMLETDKHATIVNIIENQVVISAKSNYKLLFGVSSAPK